MRATVYEFIQVNEQTAGIVSIVLVRVLRMGSLNLIHIWVRRLIVRRFCLTTTFLISLREKDLKPIEITSFKVCENVDRNQNSLRQ